MGRLWDVKMLSWNIEGTDGNFIEMKKGMASGMAL